MILSWLLMLGGTVLGYLASKRMGVMRSLTHRNLIIEQDILSVRGIVVLLAVGMYFFLAVTRKIKSLPIKRQSAWINSTLILGAAAVFYWLSDFMGTPLILIGAYLYYLAMSLNIIYE